MKRADEKLLEAIAALAGAFKSLGVPAMVIGGIAVIARGVPRHTVDVDAAVWGERLELSHLFAVLAEHGITARVPDAEVFARQRQVLLLRHDPSGQTLEISLAWLPFEWDALQRATIVDFGGVKIPVATPEDLVVYKAVAWRDRDKSDIERLLVLHGRSMNLERVRAIVKQFSETLEEPERAAEFDTLVARALTPGS